MSSRSYRQLAFVCVLVSAGFCVAPSSAEQAEAPAPPAASGAKDSAKLMKSLEALLKGYQEENTKLRARVQELEEEVERLQVAQLRLKQNKAIAVPQPGVPGQSQVPPTWKPFEFNGMTYYVVPLGDNQGAAARTITVPTGPAPSK